MNDELHASRLVEETLENQRFLGGQAAQCGAAGSEVLDQFSGLDRADPYLVDQPCKRRLAGCVPSQAQVDLIAQARYRARELVASAGGFSEPEGNRRGLAVCILHAHRAAFHAQNTIGAIAELEDVARQALDREILVDAA